jgi:hypothetical protein
MENSQEQRSYRSGDWVLREEILVVSHRWPLIVAFILIGSLLGWTAARLWPAPYQASVEMSVSLDPYAFTEDSYVPEYANIEFRNPDDYKHWQMSQLSVLAFSDEYLEDTRNRLVALDPTWEAFDVAGLRSMVSVAWRNAGRWRLSARANEPGSAVQLVEMWRRVILDKTNQAVESSRQIHLFDLEQQAIQAGILETRQEIDTLGEIQGTLTGWQESLASTPPEQTLTQAERAQVAALAASVIDLYPPPEILLEDLPPAGAAAQEYLPWLEQLLEATGETITEREARLQNLQNEQQRVEEERRAMLQAGKGVSMTLFLAVLQDSPPDTSQPRPVSMAALVGGALGLLTWGLLQLARISGGRQL